MNEKNELQDPRMARALCRFEVVSKYRALNPRRGLKKKLLEITDRYFHSGIDTLLY